MVDSHARALPPDGLPSLSTSETEAYLRRIGFSLAQFEALEKTQALRQVHVAHMLSVPFDTTATQLPSNWWTGPAETPVRVKAAGHGVGSELGLGPAESFHRVVEQRRGGYCFTLNSLFARLLIALGYRVRTLGARTNEWRPADSARVDCAWTAVSHLVLLVETEPGTEFLCDVGFGGGSPTYPIPLIHDAESESLTPGDHFRVRNEVCPDLNLEGAQKGWTLEWRGKNWWNPRYHAYLNPITFSDIETLNWFSSTSPRSLFRSFMVVSILQADGSRKSLTAHTERDSSQQVTNNVGQLIKLSIKHNVGAEEQTIIQPTYGALYTTLVEQFGWTPEACNSSIQNPKFCDL